MVSIEVLTRPHTGPSRGFGFVEIDAVDVNNVISKLNITDLDGRRLRVRTRPHPPAVWS